jgi:hypothetical protein
MTELRKRAKLSSVELSHGLLFLRHCENGSGLRSIAAAMLVALHAHAWHLFQGSGMQ